MSRISLCDCRLEPCIGLCSRVRKYYANVHITALIHDIMHRGPTAADMLTGWASMMMFLISWLSYILLHVLLAVEENKSIVLLACLSDLHVGVSLPP